MKKEKGRTFDGITRPSNETYRKNFNEIFGILTKPSVKALKYKPVPPTRIGVFFLFWTSLIFLITKFSQSPVEKFFVTLWKPYRWCFIFWYFFGSGLADKILSCLYTCILSALIISPLTFFANLIAKLDFPEAVGPEINIILDFKSMISLI